MMQKDNILETIIQVGKTLAINDEHISILSNLDLSNIWSKIDDDNIIHIFQGLVVIGNYFNWGVNSGCPEIFIYRAIMEKKLDRDLKIADWAFLNSHNPYIPFGSAGNIRYSSRDAYDYVRNSEMQHSMDLTLEAIDKINSYSSYLDQRTIEELKVTNNTLLRKASDLELEITRLKTEKENLKIRLLLTEKTNTDKAEFIINDSDRPIYFYSREIDQIIADKQVHKNILIKLRDKFKDDDNSHNRTLKNKIMNEINNR